MADHSPLPWRQADECLIFDRAGTLIVADDAMRPDDAAFIVRAVNAHADLLAALKAIRDHRESHDRGDTCGLVPCAVCQHEIGWPLLSSATPICEDCVIAHAIATAEGREP